MPQCLPQHTLLNPYILNLKVNPNILNLKVRASEPEGAPTAPLQDDAQGRHCQARMEPAYTNAHPPEP